MELSDKKLQSYLRRAEVVAENSPDLETQVGAVLVSSKTFSVISEGYNGFIRGADDSKLPKTRPDKYQYMVHAEENLLCNAARNGVSTNECFVVQTTSPCIKCARLLYQSGITTVYCANLHSSITQVKSLGDLTLKFTYLSNCIKIIIQVTQ